MKRALRRSHLERMKARAIRIYPDWPMAYKAANHLTVCSSYCCGNPRKWFKAVSVQEYKAYIRYREQMKDAGLNINTTRRRNII